MRLGEDEEILKLIIDGLIPTRGGRSRCWSLIYAVHYMRFQSADLGEHISE